MVRCIVGIRAVKVVICIGIGIIPGTVHIVISIIELHDIPGMIFTRISRHIVTGDIQLLQDILKCPRITCTYRSAIYERTVGTLVHRCIGIIDDIVQKRIMHCLFPLISRILSIRLILDELRSRLKINL